MKQQPIEYDCIVAGSPHELAEKMVDAMFDGWTREGQTDIYFKLFGLIKIYKQPISRGKHD